ncbi:MAG: SMC-Scp complex subunit ScpB [Candidatus Liptonbacteria bacterium]|nr:SMC-Scp complex subunit ScpB [Candidatus Liptonbacteria bacterium]
MENVEENLASLEALLFIQGEPIAKKRIGKILNLPLEDLEKVLGELEKRLHEESRGLSLVLDAEKVQLVTKSKFRNLLESFAKEELSEELTPASVEALSIISYLGPISRSQLDFIRGVNSTFILRNLLIRGLVERTPHPKSPNTYLYSPSFQLLRHLGLKNKEELPEYAKYQELLKNFTPLHPESMGYKDKSGHAGEGVTGFGSDGE